MAEKKRKQARKRLAPANKDVVSSEEFDKALKELLDGMSGAEILATPGAYEVFSEALNNDIIDLAKKIKEDEDDEED